MLHLQPSRSFNFAAAFICVLYFSALHAADGQPLKLPEPITRHMVDAFYPSPARRLSQEGRALVAFKVSSTGRAVDIRVSAAEPKGVFDKAAIAFMRAVEFDVPGDWEPSGGAHRELTFALVFRLQPCPGAQPREKLVPFPADYQPVIITGSVICPAPPPPRHTTRTEADHVYCQYMREQGVKPASCAEP